jgi:hypothetical protein
MAKPVKMDVARVKTIAVKFETMATVLTRIDQALEVLAGTLSRIAFCGLVGVACQTQRIRAMQERVRQLHTRMLQMRDFVDQEVEQFVKASEAG